MTFKGIPNLETIITSVTLAAAAVWAGIVVNSQGTMPPPRIESEFSAPPFAANYRNPAFWVELEKPGLPSLPYGMLDRMLRESGVLEEIEQAARDKGYNSGAPGVPPVISEGEVMYLVQKVMWPAMKAQNNMVSDAVGPYVYYQVITVEGMSSMAWEYAREKSSIGIRFQGSDTVYSIVERAFCVSPDSPQGKALIAGTNVLVNVARVPNPLRDNIVVRR